MSSLTKKSPKVSNTENKKYLVGVREVHVSFREVTASSESEAVQKVKDMDDEEVYCEYSHTLDEDTWSVEESKEEV